MPLRCRVLVALASACAVLALLGAWADRQLLDTDEWTETSAALLRDDAIRVPLADELAAQIADGSRTTAALREILPPRLQPLAEPAGSVVREAAQRASQRALESGGVQATWVALNRATHAQLVDLIDGGGTVVAGRGVVLDLRPLAKRVAQQAGFSGDRIDRLPPPRGRIVIMTEDQLSALRTVGRVLGALSWIPGVVALLLYALALRLGRGSRRRVVLASGAGLAIAALLVLVLRQIAGREVVGALTSGGSLEPAAAAVWRIATTLLVELSVAVLIVGAVAFAGAWLAGDGRRAQWLRARIAPALAVDPTAVYGVTAVAYLALVAWGPLAVLHRPLAIVIFGLLLLAGVWALRAQVVRELRDGGA